MLIHSNEFNVRDLVNRLITFWDSNDCLECGRVMDMKDVSDSDSPDNRVSLIEIQTESGHLHHITIEQFYGILTEEETHASQ